jgi:threonine dehydratase
MHERVTADLRVDEAEVNLHLETRGPEHCDSVITQLRKAGYSLRFSGPLPGRGRLVALGER